MPLETWAVLCPLNGLGLGLGFFLLLLKAVKIIVSADKQLVVDGSAPCLLPVCRHCIV